MSQHRQPIQRIYIIGMPGAGKSTLGKYLAHALKWDFVDADRVLEKKCGASISWIFELEGESGFRARESAQLQELSQLSRTVISTGGGVILAPENRDVMKKTGTMLYLRASFDTLFERVTRDDSRPLLAQNTKQNLHRLLELREPIYQELADITIDTHAHAQAKAMARQIAEQMSPKLIKPLS